MTIKREIEVLRGLDRTLAITNRMNMEQPFYDRVLLEYMEFYDNFIQKIDRVVAEKNRNKRVILLCYFEIDDDDYKNNKLVSCQDMAGLYHTIYELEFRFNRVMAGGHGYINHVR